MMGVFVPGLYSSLCAIVLSHASLLCGTMQDPSEPVSRKSISLELLEDPSLLD